MYQIGVILFILFRQVKALHISYIHELDVQCFLQNKDESEGNSSEVWKRNPTSNTRICALKIKPFKWSNNVADRE